MKAIVTDITGYSDAIQVLYLSKRNWSMELAEDVDALLEVSTTPDGRIEDPDTIRPYMDKLFKYGRIHTTLLRFIDISITTLGMHRGGQDDIDSHAARFNNRIVRNSTRLAKFQDEKSSWYEDKIITLPEALSMEDIALPETIEKDGETFVNVGLGYVRKGMENDHDVLRGLYPLSIPSDFIAKINVTEWAHVFRMRNASTHASPEVREWAESVQDQIEMFCPWLTREYVLSIEN